jgi:hypothetical protein
MYWEDHVGFEHIQKPDSDANAALAEEECLELAEGDLTGEAIEALVQATRRREPRVRGAAVDALGRLLGYREDPPTELRQYALNALRTLLDSERDATVVSTILSSIGLVGTTGDIPRVNNFADWPDDRVCRQARWAARYLSAGETSSRLFPQRLVGAWSGSRGGRLRFASDKSFQATARFDILGEQVRVVHGWWFEPDLASVTLEVDIPEVVDDFVIVHLTVVGRDAAASLVYTGADGNEVYRHG